MLVKLDLITTLSQFGAQRKLVLCKILSPPIQMQTKRILLYRVNEE